MKTSEQARYFFFVNLWTYKDVLLFPITSADRIKHLKCSPVPILAWTTHYVTSVSRIDITRNWPRMIGIPYWWTEKDIYKMASGPRKNLVH